MCTYGCVRVGVCECADPYVDHQSDTNLMCMWVLVCVCVWRLIRFLRVWVGGMGVCVCVCVSVCVCVCEMC